MRVRGMMLDFLGEVMLLEDAVPGIVEVPRLKAAGGQTGLPVFLVHDLFKIGFNPIFRAKPFHPLISAAPISPWARDPHKSSAATILLPPSNS